MNTLNQSELVAKELNDQVEAEILAMSEDDASQVNIDIPSMFTRTSTIVGNIQPFMGEIVAGAASWDVDLIRKLGAYGRAMVLRHSEYLYMAENKPEMARLAEVAANRRAQLLAGVESLVAFNVVPKEAVKLAGAVGYRNIATDLLTLAGLVLHYWPSIQGRIPLTQEEAEQAKSMAMELYAAIAKAEEHEVKIAEAALRRRAAFTLCLRAFQETKRAIDCVRFHEKDADLLVPTLYETGGGRKGKPEVKVEPLVPVPPANPVEPKPQPEAPAKPGFPGGSPFANG
jgi:hypothetical protein